MKIGVISDTHDRVPTFKQAVDIFRDRQVEAILHAGDFVAPFAAKLLKPDHAPAPVYCIYGNNDGEREGLRKTLPQLQDGPLRVELGGRTIAMHHYLDWFSEADVQGADVVISGHDHTVNVETRDGRLYLNPGECCGWVVGRCSVAILDTAGPEAEIVDIEP
jgi:putative phosphoesterase